MYVYLFELILFLVTFVEWMFYLFIYLFYYHYSFSLLPTLEADVHHTRTISELYY